MADTGDRRLEAVQQGRPAGSEAAPPDAKQGSPTAPAGESTALDPHATPTTGPHPAAPPKQSEATPPAHCRRKWLWLAALVVGLAVGGCFLYPVVDTMLNTIS